MSWEMGEHRKGETGKKREKEEKTIVIIVKREASYVIPNPLLKVVYFYAFLWKKLWKKSVVFHKGF